MREILCVAYAPYLIPKASYWFAQKWGIAQYEYEQSMLESVHIAQQLQVRIPQWYVVLEKEKNRIIAGAGVIENDFHTRKDLSPNVCALYVEQQYRKQGIARALLEHIRREMYVYKKLYLLTEHKEFYEKCGWKYVCEAQTDDKKGGKIYEVATLRDS